MIPSCKKEKEPQVLSEPTSFDVPALVHVYGGYPFTLPIVTEPEVSDISALEFEHPDKENFRLKIVDNQAVLTYIPRDENFINAIDPAYLKGYMGINIKSSSSYDPYSAANQVNRLFGMNQQGTEIIRASMFANRYPFEKAFALFGAVEGCGAQIPLP